MYRVCIRRIYGERGEDVLNAVARDPVNNIPIVLKRLKQKVLEAQSASFVRSLRCCVLLHRVSGQPTHGRSPLVMTCSTTSGAALKSNGTSSGARALRRTTLSLWMLRYAFNVARDEKHDTSYSSSPVESR